MQRRQLFDHLAEVIVTISPECDGKSCAAKGYSGRMIVGRIRAVLASRIEAGHVEPSYNLLDFIDEGFDLMIKDYRITRDALEQLQLAYCTARLIAGVRALA